MKEVNIFEILGGKMDRIYWLDVGDKRGASQG